jgi:hypothetical protein
MDQQEQKKAWVTPELIVLIRSQPEESVLTACKELFTPGTPANNYGGCQTRAGTKCPECSALRNS